MSTLQLERDDELVEFLGRSNRTPEAAARELIVMDLYRRGVISGGKGSEFLAIPQLEFIQRASELGIPHFRFSENEWRDEIAESERI